MEIRELFNCKWSAEHYIDHNPELYNHNRVKLTCVESNNPVYPVGAVFSCADNGIPA